MQKLMITLSLLTIVASGCATKSIQTSVDHHEVNKQTVAAGVPEAELNKVNLAIVRLNNEIAALDTLETKVYAKSLKADKKVQKQLEAKTTEYGSIETLQANLRVLLELKQVYEQAPVKPVETASNKK